MPEYQTVNLLIVIIHRFTDVFSCIMLTLSELGLT